MKTILNFVMIVLLVQITYTPMTAQACTGVVNTFPLEQDFENTANLWDQWVSAPYPWINIIGPTPTPFTGPNGASNGSRYMYVEATGQAGSGVILSPCLDLTSLTTPQLSFDYHLYGQDAFRLVIQGSTDGGNTWGNIVFFVSNDQGPNWIPETVDLSPYLTETNFRLRFIGVVNDVNGNDEGDVAIDNIRIGDAPACFEISVNYANETCNAANDGSATLLVYPANTQGLDILWSTGATTSSISNLAPGNYSVEVTDNNSCTKVKNFTILETSPISADLFIVPTSGVGNADGRAIAIVSGGTPPYSYQWENGSTTSSILYVINGYEELTVTDANGCQATFPTFIPAIDLCSDVYDNWPYSLSFEGGLGRFKQGIDDNRNWKKRTGATPTSNTGPSGAIQGVNYRYIESSGNGGPFKTGVIVSKRCFDISNLTDPELTFKYHMYGAQMGQLFVQVSTNGGYIWNENIWEVSGDQGNAWQTATIDLSEVSSTNLMIRIVGRTGAGQLSDIAIDDLHIQTNVPLVQRETEPNSTRSDIDANSMTESIEMVTKVYPNPVDQKLNIEHLDQVAQLHLLNLQGQRVISTKANGEQTILNVDFLENGMYILQAVHQNGEISVRKILKL
ncbi:MAG: T9SS type A sorting domain-containing protein [Saprospiraceae bacterium]|nr:T9SS type A sorting domain-containing protein [Saprospiraceae bacterium]